MRSCVFVSLMTLAEGTLLMVLLISTTVVCSAQCTVVMPDVVSAVLGSCAEMPCTFDNINYFTNLKGRWIKRVPGPGPPNNSIIYDSRDPLKQHYNYSGRAEFKGNLAIGQCSLLIKGIRKSDEGTYHFLVSITSAWNSIPHRIDRSEVFLSVSEKPEISGSGELIAGQTARLVCSITHNCPDGILQLKWINYNASLPLPWDTQDRAGIVNERSGSRTVSSVLTFTPSSAHHGAILGCTIMVDGFETSSPQTLILEIKYGLEIPTVNSPIVALEGSSVLLYCTAPGKSLVSLRWVKNGEEISTSSTGELKQILHSISSEDDGEYWCIAENALGNVTRSTQISVQYKPTIVAGPTCTSSEYWTNCTCSVKANPPANITWSLNGRIIRSDVEVISWAVTSYLVQSSLRLTHPTGTGNLISCVAANEHGDSVSKHQLHSEGIFSRTIVLIIGAGATGLVILIAVFLSVKIQRCRPSTANDSTTAIVTKGARTLLKRCREASRVSETQDDLVIYSTVQKALNPERDDQYTHDGYGAPQLTKPAQCQEIVYATVNVSNFRKHD